MQKSEIFQSSKRIAVTEIVVHCSATPSNWFADKSSQEKVNEIRRWHTKDRGWKDIGYHYVIDRNGNTISGRAETVIGAGVVARNSGVLHVCLVGGGASDESDLFS